MQSALSLKLFDFTKSRRLNPTGCLVGGHLIPNTG